MCSSRGLVLLLPASRRTAALPHLVSFATRCAARCRTPQAAAACDPGRGTVQASRHAVADRWHLRVLRAGKAGALATLSRSRLRFAHPSDKQRDYASAMLILAGDAITMRSMGDAAAAFLTDVRLGIVAGIAVIAHEVRRGDGDFAILCFRRASRARARRSTC